MGMVRPLATDLERGLRETHPALRKTVATKVALAEAAIREMQTPSTVEPANRLPLDTERQDMRVQWRRRLLKNPLLSSSKTQAQTDPNRWGFKKSSRTTRGLAARALVAAMTWLLSISAIAAEFKVLVVMSYEEDNPWVKEIREGIEGVLSPSSEIRYFYMNTKADRASGPKCAEEAYALFQQFQPDGVIAADDDAQAMFVEPFLKDKIDKPVMFNGVNTEPDQYGFPSRNVSGVLERAHVRESLSFIKQLLPSVQNVCFLTNNVPPGQSLRAQVMRERDSYPGTVSDFHLVSTTGALAELKQSLNASCDALFIDSLEGITDQSGKSLTNVEISQLLKDIYRGPTLAGNRYQVEQGALAAVVKTGQEQGEKSAEMLLQAMRGKPVATIPIMQNVQGQRIINVTELERRGITLKPIVLRGATLVREQP